MYVEEERRVLYVALTRCKKKTVIVYDADRPALFINECLSGHENSSVVKLNLDTKEEILETPSEIIENNKKQKSEASEIVLKEIGFDDTTEAISTLTNVNSKTKANVDGAILTDEDNVDSPKISDKISIKELAIGDELEDLENWNNLEIFGSTHRSTIDFDNISLDDLDNELNLLG
jgi:ATP-dependent exoDNAse (exonuclease V) beta subunit